MHRLPASFTIAHARLATLGEVRALALWEHGFRHLAKDHRFYEIVDETLRADFEFLYLLLEDAEGSVCAIQPVFFVAQDLIATAPAPARFLVEKIRAWFPRFLHLRMLMAGCAAGEGHPGGEAQEDWRQACSAAARFLPKIARDGGAWLVIWKDWPAAYRQACAGLLEKANFVCVPSMPATTLALNFSSFEDYMRRHLSHAMRKNLRRKFRATRQAPLQMSVVHSVADIVDEVHALYEQVLARSPLKFERLTREFLLQLGERMPERARFFLWRHEGRLVACSVCLLHEGTLYDEYLGLDYTVALKLHLYFVTLRDVLSWAMANGIRAYASTPLNYDPKLHLGFELAPLDLYVAGTSPLLQAFVRRVLPWIKPTRSLPVLLEFPNAHAMEPGSGG